MDIYSFLRSRDVASHCREIKKTWNTCEMACIIARSNQSINEKHIAWQVLIENYPDMPVLPNIHEVNFISIHNELSEIINYEHQIMERFMTPEQGMVYRYKVWLEDGYAASDAVFSSYEKALKNAQSCWEESEAMEICFEKILIDYGFSNWGRGAVIEAWADYKGCLYDIDLCCEDKTRARLFPTTKHRKTGAEIFKEELYVDIPTPFKRGDILVSCHHFGKATPLIFVLDSLDRDNPQWLERLLSGKWGDGTDLVGWGYYVDDLGRMYGDHTHDHDTFEYYLGRLEGKERLLHYVSLLMKKEIDIPSLLTMQSRIIMEHQLNNTLSIHHHGLFIPEYLLAENRFTNDEDSNFEQENSIFPWLQGKLSIHQIDFLSKETGRDRRSVQMELSDGGGLLLGKCAEIVHDENHYENLDDIKFNPARRTMARLVLEAYKKNEDGWIDKWGGETDCKE